MPHKKKKKKKKKIVGHSDDEKKTFVPNMEGPDGLYVQEEELTINMESWMTEMTTESWTVTWRS
jgi:hypothetical protein